MMTAAIKGKSRADADILIHEFFAMATGNQRGHRIKEAIH
jgi:NifU-like protein involved in Fe-S cluster formation